MPNRHTNLNFNYRSNTIKKKKKQKGGTWQDQAYTFLREGAEFNERKDKWFGRRNTVLLKCSE